MTALMYVIVEGYENPRDMPGIVEDLLERGAYINLKSNV
jgi:hypothetical protein